MTYCNVAYPCGNHASLALKVFGTTPRFVCYMHERDMREKGAEMRELGTFPGPWVAPSIHKDGEVALTHTCPVPTCIGMVCNGGQR